MSTSDRTTCRISREGVRLSVIAPCFNEQDNIVSLVKRTLAVLDQSQIAGELVLVDDGSSDATWQEICRQQRRDDRVCGVQHEINKGMEQAWLTGIHAASGELICLIDADLQNRPEDIPALYHSHLQKHGSLAQGVRHPVQRNHERLTFSKGLNALLNLVFQARLQDNKSGFLLCPRDTLLHVLAHRYRYRYYQSFIGVAALARGYKVVEVDTVFEQRHAGESFLSRIPIRVSLIILWEMLKFRFELWGEDRSRTSPSGCTSSNVLAPDSPIGDR